MASYFLSCLIPDKCHTNLNEMAFGNTCDEDNRFDDNSIGIVIKIARRFAEELWRCNEKHLQKTSHLLPFQELNSSIDRIPHAGHDDHKTKPSCSNIKSLFIGIDEDTLCHSSRERLKTVVSKYGTSFDASVIIQFDCSYVNGASLDDGHRNHTFCVVIKSAASTSVNTASILGNV